MSIRPAGTACCPLRDYQAAAVERLAAGLGRRPILVAPTGSGKTVMAVALVERLGVPTLWLAHRKELIQQAADHLRDYGLTAGVIMPGFPVFPLAYVQVASVQTMIRRLDRRPQAGLVVIDECFPAGTLVDNLPIDERRIGDCVRTHAGWGCVTHVFQRRTGVICKIRFVSGRGLICTPNHPIWTPVGFQPAASLKPGYMVAVDLRGKSHERLPITSMLGLRHEVLPAEYQEWSGASKKDKGAVPTSRMQDRAQSSNNRQHACPLRGRDHTISQDERHAPTRSPGLGVTTIERHGLDAAGTDGQRTTHPTTEGVIDSPWLEVRGSHSNGTTGQRISNLLQGGHRQPRNEDCRRGRWQFPQHYGQEKGRPQEGRILGLDRVESVEVYERGSGSEFERLCPGGVVFNLEVSNGNTYFADDVLVHNCHHATADSYRGVLDAYPTARVVGLTATPFRLDGQGLGDIFGEIVVSAWPDELCEAGVLHRPRVYSTLSPPDLRGVKVTAGDYNLRQLEQRVNTAAANADVVKTWLKRAAGARTVCFAVDIQHSRTICAAFAAAAVAAEHLDGASAPRQRDAILGRLRAGQTQVVSNCMVLTEGWDLPALECAIIARPTASLNLHLQMIGRIMRACPQKKGCIAEGQLVLTDHGLVPIERVSSKWRVWDGTEWVCHDGPVFQGKQEVITYDGLTATPEHRVWTQAGWKEIGKCALEQIPLVQTGLGRTPIRQRNSIVREHRTPRSGEQVVRSRALRNLPKRILGQLQQHLARTLQRMPTLQSAPSGPQVVMDSVDECENAVSKSKGQTVPKLWRARNQIPLFVGTRRSPMGAIASWFTARMRVGPDQQRRELRTRKSSMVDRQAKHVSHADDKVFRQISSIQDVTPGSSLRGRNAATPARQLDLRTDCGSLVRPIAQTQRRVWDLLNCGPRHCFTVSDRLVHNCIVLDHAGNHHVHGLVTRRLDYSLEDDRKVGSSEPLGLRRCRACGLFFETTRFACPECRWAPQRAEYAERKRLDIHGDGELGEFDEGSFDCRRAVWNMFEAQRQSMCYKPGWSYFRFKERFGVDPVVAGGELIDPARASQQEKRAVYEQFLAVAAEHGYANGWASHRFKNCFGHWPRGFVSDVRQQRLREKWSPVATGKT